MSSAQLNHTQLNHPNTARSELRVAESKLWELGLRYSNPQIVCKIQTIQRFSISKIMTKSKSIVFLRISHLYVLSTTNTFPFDMYSHTYDSLWFRKKHPHNVHIYTNCIFSEDVIVSPTKIMNNLFKDYKILTFSIKNQPNLSDFFMKNIRLGI